MRDIPIEYVDNTRGASEDFDWPSVYGEDPEVPDIYCLAADAVSDMWRFVAGATRPRSREARMVAVLWVSSSTFSQYSLRELCKSWRVSYITAARAAAQYSRVFGIVNERQSHYSLRRRGGVQKQDTKGKESFKPRSTAFSASLHRMPVCKPVTKSRTKKGDKS